jgi:hypothetical protein
MIKNINKKVLELKEIPLDIQLPDWLENKYEHAYIECHLDETYNETELSKWIMKTYPELLEDSFLIH